MQNFKRYGVRFAIIFSAILFGIYHGNIVQTPFAFILGLLLGYITVSYGLKYAIAVHIFNNMVLADFLDRFLQLFSENTATTISTIIMGSLALGDFIIYIVFGIHNVKNYLPRSTIPS